MLPKFFLANDASNSKEALNNLNKISSVPDNYGIKLNLDLVLRDINIIGKVIDKTNRAVFVDLKMWNGKRTMNEVIKTVAARGASMINVYALADSMLERAIETAKKVNLTVLGVTVLTHYDNDYCLKFHNMPLLDLVRLLAENTLKRGCDGYILPGTTLEAVYDLKGIKFNPAVRPNWYKDKNINAQKQIMEPKEALKNGASIVSCGSPVFKSANPAEALQLIIDEVEATKL